MNVVAMTLLTVLTTVAQTDTVVPIERGSRLNVFNLGGGVNVVVWDQSAVRIVARHTERALVEVQRSGPVLLVRAKAPRAPAGDVQYDIRVPKWIDLDIHGINNAVSVQGVDGEVRVETVRGGVDVQGGKGLVQLRSLDGVVRVRGTRGRVYASSVNDGVLVMDTRGEVVANTVNGHIVLDGIVSDMVEAMSANGDLIWEGDFGQHGRYQFGTHNGNIVVVTKERPDATVQVRTFNGDFESSFPVELQESQGNRTFNFTFGNGNAQLDVESFQGRIQLLQAGTERAQRALEARARALQRMQTDARPADAGRGGQKSGKDQ
jgi:hypothetical protein